MSAAASATRSTWPPKCWAGAPPASTRRSTLAEGAALLQADIRKDYLTADTDLGEPVRPGDGVRGDRARARPLRLPRRAAPLAEARRHARADHAGRRRADALARPGQPDRHPGAQGPPHPVQQGLARLRAAPRRVPPRPGAGRAGRAGRLRVGPAAPLPRRRRRAPRAGLQALPRAPRRNRRAGLRALEWRRRAAVYPAGR